MKKFILKYKIIIMCTSIVSILVISVVATIIIIGSQLIKKTDWNNLHSKDFQTVISIHNKQKIPLNPEFLFSKQLDKMPSSFDNTSINKYKVVTSGKLSYSEYNSSNHHNLINKKPDIDLSTLTFKETPAWEDWSHEILPLVGNDVNQFVVFTANVKKTNYTFNINIIYINQPKFIQKYLKPIPIYGEIIKRMQERAFIVATKMPWDTSAAVDMNISKPLLSNLSIKIS